LRVQGFADAFAEQVQIDKEKKERDRIAILNHITAEATGSKSVPKTTYLRQESDEGSSSVVSAHRDSGAEQVYAALAVKADVQFKTQVKRLFGRK